MMMGLLCGYAGHTRRSDATSEADVGAAPADDALAGFALPIPICADESCRTLADLDRLDGKYQAINIKLDKAGGLTEALSLAADAKRRGLRIMVGGTIGTSIGTAPAPLVAQRAKMVDLGRPLFLASDRFPGMRYEGSTILPAEPHFWGGPGRYWSIGR